MYEIRKYIYIYIKQYNYSKQINLLIMYIGNIIYKILYTRYYLTLIKIGYRKYYFH